MITVSYYVACSLDGFIATVDGGVDWLSEFHVEGEDFGYAKFFESVDAMVMGSATYEQVLGFGEWPYGDKLCWVMSQRPIQAVRPEITITALDPTGILAEIEDHHLTRAWLVGGARAAGAFRAHGLIDEYLITVLPTLLGDGVPLFVDDGPRLNLQLMKNGSAGKGAVTLHYCRSEDG
jgi:dihydrofolate reductase